MIALDRHIFTSEPVTEGHPDKVCDYIADSVLDAHLTGDPQSRVACEVLCKGAHVVLAGEISSHVTVDHAEIARRAIQEIGYTAREQEFNAAGVQIQQLFTTQAPEIACGVNGHLERKDQGAGDQGIMFGYATDETPQMMPLPIALAHRLSRTLAEDRHSKVEPWLGPDAKTQVSVLYEENKPVRVANVLVSTQHSPEISREEIQEYVARRLGPRALGDWYCDTITLPCSVAWPVPLAR